MHHQGGTLHWKPTSQRRKLIASLRQTKAQPDGWAFLLPNNAVLSHLRECVVDKPLKIESSLHAVSAKPEHVFVVPGWPRNW